MGNFHEKIGLVKMNRAHLVDQQFKRYMDVFTYGKALRNLLFLVK